MLSARASGTELRAGLLGRQVVRGAGAGALVVLLALSAARAGAQDASAAETSAQSFSAEERRQLAAGELVARPVSRRQGSLRLIGGTSFQVVDQPVEVTWRALCDSGRYARMLPAAEEARVVSRGRGQRVVRVLHAAGLISASYHLRMRYDRERRDVAFRLDESRPNDLRAAWGFISVSAFDDDPSRSLVSYGVMADVGGGVVGGILRGQIHSWMLRVPATIRDYLHGSGRDRYTEG